MLRLSFHMFLALTVLPLAARTLFAAPTASYLGQVLIKNDDCLILRGREWSGWVTFSSAPVCAEGDLVRVTGRLHPFKWMDVGLLELADLEVVGRSPLPETRDVAGRDIPDGRLLFDFVRITGVLTAVSHGERGWNWAVVRTETGDVGVTIRTGDHTYGELYALIDAEVSIRGIVVYSWGNERALGAHLSQRGANALSVLAPPPRDAFSAAPFTKAFRPHRQTATGTVLSLGSRLLVVETAEHGVVKVIPAPESPIPAIGRRVTVAGFAETDPVNLLFRGALCRDDGPGRLDARTPLVPTLDRLMDGRVHGQTVTLEGRVPESSFAPSSPRQFSLACSGHEIIVDAASLRTDDFRMPKAGTRLRVTGICLSDYENAAPADVFPRLRSILLLPRAPQDVVVLETPSWWTPARLTTCLVLLLAVYGLREVTSRSLMRFRLRERMLLAVDLHDHLAQILTGISLQLDAAELADQNGRPQMAKAHLAHARQALRSCRENLRCCLGDLRSDLPGSADMNAFIRRCVAPHIGTVRLSVRINVPRSALSERALFALGKIVRELAVNAARHGKPRRIFIAGERRDGQVRISVHDDGCGFDPGNVPGPDEGHFGLAGVRERLKAFRGRLSISSRPGHGTRALISLPT